MVYLFRYNRMYRLKWISLHPEKEATMNYDLQKANPLKRLTAWLLDAILLCVLTTCFIWAVSDIVGLSNKTADLNAYYEHYEAEYNVSFTTDQESYNAMTEQERQDYDARLEKAQEAMVNDPAVMDAYLAWVQSLILAVCIGIFLAKLILEFLIPLWLRNGQTVGKKVFGLAVMRTNSVQINGVRLFIRAILGKYTIETMVPVFMLILAFTGAMGGLAMLLVMVLFAVQIILMITTPTNARIHDLMADTVVVDMQSQLIFDSEQSRTEYQQRIAAEKAQQSPYR